MLSVAFPHYSLIVLTCSLYQLCCYLNRQGSQITKDQGVRLNFLTRKVFHSSVYSFSKSKETSETAKTAPFLQKLYARRASYFSFLIILLELDQAHRINPPAYYLCPKDYYNIDFQVERKALQHFLSFIDLQ